MNYNIEFDQSVNADYKYKIVAAKLGSNVTNLNTLVSSNDRVEFYDMSSPFGNRIYSRSLELLANVASRKLFGKDTDVLIIDPPRSGLYKGMIEDILKFNSKKIIYVSCNPITLVRDLNQLKEKYNIIEVQPLDMFPNTYHCESITVLERR